MKLTPTNNPNAAEQAAEHAPDETLLDFLDWLKTQPSTGRSKAEIDAEIAQERAAWDSR